MNIFIAHVIIGWFNNNTGVLNGFNVGAIVRTELSAAKCVRDATAVCCNVRRHMMNVANMIFTVFVHIVAVHTVMQLMRISYIVPIADATETIQFENMVLLPIHAIAVFIWRNIRIDTIRSDIVCIT